MIWWDPDLKGFGLKVTPAGRKVFLVQYRPAGDRGNPRKYTIGEMGQSRRTRPGSKPSGSSRTDRQDDIDKRKSSSREGV